MLVLDEKGTVTLPPELMQHLGIEDGGTLELEFLPNRRIRIWKSSDVHFDEAQCNGNVSPPQVC